MTLNKQILITFILLLFSILFFAFTPLDDVIQSNFFNQETQSWMLDKNAQPYKFIFYDGIKTLLILFALFLLYLYFQKSNTCSPYKKGLIIVILSAILVPLIVGGLKKKTNMPCPQNLINYGGSYPKTAVWESYPQSFKNKKHISCWPAGHASGGFALLSLFFLFRKRKNKIIALSIGLTIGWTMGIYKMLIGDHFFSHTFITMVLAWLIVLIVAKITFKLMLR